MDSGNSGSLQSSSGGADDELDAACADSSTSSPLAALLRHQGFGDGGASSLIYGLQDLATPPVSSHWCSTTARLPAAGAGGASASSPPPSLPCHGGLEVTAPEAEQAAAAATAVTAQPAAAAPPQGSRKRARASRRAPTTVLTTDTSNFRAMVQEFTGIPSPPFAALSSRYDHLFPSRSSSSSSSSPSAAVAAASLPQYMLGPFVYLPPPSASSPAPANAAIAASTAAPGATAVASGDSYEPSALLGMQQDHSGVNSYLSFQSTLAAAHLDGGDAKYPSFEGGVGPSSISRLQEQDPRTGFLVGVAHGVVMSSEGTHAHLRPRNGDRGGDELLSGLVGGCKATYSSSSAPPPLERNGRSQPAGVSTATPTPPPVAMRTQVVESWVCSTSSE